MRTQPIDSVAAWPEELIPTGGALVLRGYGLDIRVWRGRLRVEDGMGRGRRSGILDRATSGLRRLVGLGHTGSISLEAIRWLTDIGAGYEQIDADGRVLASLGPSGVAQPTLRRAQAMAPDTAIGLNAARQLLQRKVAAQRA